MIGMEDLPGVPEPARFFGSDASQALVVPEQPAKPAPKRFVRQQIPDDILNNESLKTAMKVLPQNYNFEIMKTVARLRAAGARHVALQFPEGLLMYACTISDILEQFAPLEQTCILGDVTYGACCIDDMSAAALGADLLVHYGHSCLVPVTVTTVPCLYVFVEIQLDVPHLVDTVVHNFGRGARLLLAGVIQFSSAIQDAKLALQEQGFGEICIPQDRPLSAGETLGCTAPSVSAEADAILFVADGRFHLEALMIANPTLPAFRYDPYGRTLFREEYDQVGMRAARRAAIEKARTCTSWGLVLGTLGRQGNPALLAKIQALLEATGVRHSLVLLSEVTPEKLALMHGVDAWVQIACPRLSIDWGEGFKKPTLTSFEAMVALGAAPEWWSQKENGPGESDGSAKIAHYPMDYYSKNGGEWSSSYHKAPARRRPEVQPVAAGS